MRRPSAHSERHSSRWSCGSSFLGVVAARAPQQTALLLNVALLFRRNTVVTDVRYLSFDLIQVRSSRCPKAPADEAAGDPRRRHRRFRDGSADPPPRVPWRALEDRGAPRPGGLRRKGPGIYLSRRPYELWLKVKQRHEGGFLVGGIRNVDAFDGVLVGELVDGALRFRGVVEWGYRAADVLTVLQYAKDYPLRTSPFIDAPKMRNAVWMEPRLRAEVSYAEIVEGRLGAPAWRALAGAPTVKRSQEPPRTGPPW